MDTQFKVGDPVIYESRDNAYSAYNGLDAVIVQIIDKPDNWHEVRALPLYEIRFTWPLSSRTVEAWPDELRKCSY